MTNQKVKECRPRSKVCLIISISVIVWFIAGVFSTGFAFYRILISLVTPLPVSQEISSIEMDLNNPVKRLAQNEYKIEIMHDYFGSVASSRGGSSGSSSGSSNGFFMNFS